MALDEFGGVVVDEPSVAQGQDEFGGKVVDESAQPKPQDPNWPAKRAGYFEQLQKLRDESDAPVYGGTPKGYATEGAGFLSKMGTAVSKGLALLGELTPPVSPDDYTVGMDKRKMDMLTAHTEKISDPVKFREAMETNPLYTFAKGNEKYYQDLYEKYVPDKERETVGHQLMGAAAGLAPAATGPLAPFIFALDSAGEHFDKDYDRLLEEGKSKEDAAKEAADNAFLSGAKEAALWEFGPRALRRLAVDKIKRLGGPAADWATQWLRSHGATAAELSALSAGSTASENLIEGKPVGEGVGTAAASGALLGGAMPSGVTLNALRDPTLRRIKRGSSNVPVEPGPIGVIPEGGTEPVAAEGAKTVDELQTKLDQAKDQSALTPEARGRLIVTGARILIKRGVNPDVANRFSAMFVDQSGQDKISEAFREDINKAFDSAGFLDEGANVYSDESRLRAAAEASGFDEGQIQAGIEKRKQRAAEIEQHNLARMNELSPLPETTQGEQNAPTQGKEKSGEQLPRTEAGKTVPQDADQVRQADSQQTDGGDRAQGGGNVPTETPPEKVAPITLLPAINTPKGPVAGTAGEIHADIRKRLASHEDPDVALSGMDQKNSGFVDPNNPNVWLDRKQAAALIKEQHPDFKLLDEEMGLQSQDLPRLAEYLSEKPEESEKQVSEPSQNQPVTESVSPTVHKETPISEQKPTIPVDEPVKPSNLPVNPQEKPALSESESRVPKAEVAEPPPAPPETKPQTGEPPPPKKPTTTSAPPSDVAKPETRTPIEILNQAAKVKLTVPDGATQIRATDSKGRKSVVSVAEANKSDNLFLGADIVKVEAGTIDKSGKFKPLEGDVGIVDRATLKVESPDRVAKAIAKLESMKANVTGAQVMSAIMPGLDPASFKKVWNLGLDTAIAGLKAGKLISEVVDSFIKYLGEKAVEAKSFFDEASARIQIESELTHATESEQDRMKRHQTMGVPYLGSEYQPEHIEATQNIIRVKHFDGSQPVTPGATDNFWELARQLTDEKQAKDTASDIYKTVLDSTKAPAANLAPGLLMVELQNYAIRMAANGDVGALRYVVDHSNEFHIDVGGTVSAAATALRALRESNTVLKTLKMVADAQAKAAGTRLGIGPELFNHLVTALQQTKFSPDQIEAVLRQGKDSQGRTLEDLLAIPSTSMSDPDALLTIISQLPMHAGPAELRIVPVSLADRIMKMFPLMNMRDKLEQSGSKALEHNWWQLFAGRRAPEGALWSAQKALQGELGQILKEAFTRSGGALAESLPKITDEARLAQVLGKEELRTARVKLVDENVRAGLKDRMAKEMAEAGEDDGQQQAVAEKYRQLESMWDEAMSSMIGRPASDRLLRRMVINEIRESKLDFNSMFDRGVAEGNFEAVREKVVDSLMERLKGEMTETGKPGSVREANLGIVEDAFRRTFDEVHDAARNRWEMNQIGERARKAMQQTDRPEQAAQSIIKKLTETPADKDAKKTGVSEAVRNYLNGDIPNRDEFRATLETLNVNKRTIEKLLDAVDSEKASRGIERYFRQRDLELNRQKRAAERLAGEAERTAKSKLEEYEKRGTEWLKPEGRRNAVVEIIRDYLKADTSIPESPSGKDTEASNLAAKLREAGVTQSTAAQLARELQLERELRWGNKRVRQMESAANSKNLRSLTESILATPYRAQNDPAWRQKTAEDWFISNGLSPDQAKAAAGIYEKQFSDALNKAREAAARKVVDAEAQRMKNGGPQMIERVMKALNTGLLDPNKPWPDDLKDRTGFRPLTDEQMAKLSSLQEQYANPDLMPPQQQAILEQMHGILRHVGTHDRAWQLALGEWHAANLLIGPRTLLLHIFQAPASMLIRDLPTAAIFQIGDLPMLSKGMLKAAASWWPQFRNSWQTDAYGLAGRKMFTFHNELKRQFEIAVEDWNKGNYLKATFRHSYAWGQYVLRFLQTATHAGMVMKQQWDLLLTGSQIMRDAGFSIPQRRELVDVMFNLKGDALEDGITRLGLSKTEAAAHADFVAAQLFRDWVANRVGSDSEAAKMAFAAEAAAHSAVGYRMEGIKEKDEGWLSNYGPNQFMQYMSEMRRQGGLKSILGIAGFGFVNIPLRVARYNANFSGYGILRYGVYKYRTNRGLESPWKQSMANDLQARQVLRQGLAGLALASGALTWALFHSSADDESKRKGFFMYVTGHGPKNKTLFDAWYKAGNRRFSIVIGYDDKVKFSAPITRVGGALAWPLGFSSVRDDLQWRVKEAAAGKHPVNIRALDYVSGAIGTYAEIVGAQGIFQSISHFARIAESGGGIPQMLASALSSTAAAILIPGKQLWQFVDETLLGTPDRSSIESAVAANFPVYNQLPGLIGHALGHGNEWDVRFPAINRFGDPLRDQGLYDTMTRLGLPGVKVADSSENQRLYTALVNKGIAPPDLRRSVIEERYRPMTDSEWQDFTVASGKELKQATLGNLDMISSLPSEDGKKIIGKAAQISDSNAATGMGLERSTPPQGSSGGGGYGGSSAGASSSKPSILQKSPVSSSTSRISIGPAPRGVAQAGVSARGAGGSPRLRVSGAPRVATGAPARLVSGKLRVRTSYGTGSERSRRSRAPRIRLGRSKVTA